MSLHSITIVNCYSIATQVCLEDCHSAPWFSNMLSFTYVITTCSAVMRPLLNRTLCCREIERWLHVLAVAAGSHHCHCLLSRLCDLSQQSCMPTLVFKHPLQKSTVDKRKMSLRFLLWTMAAYIMLSTAMAKSSHSLCFDF